MAGFRWPPEDIEQTQSLSSFRFQPGAAAEFFSDDDRSVAADSWSIKSEYGSTLDDEQRQADAVEALSIVSFREQGYSSDKEEQDTEVEPSVLGLQSHWDATYTEELANFHEHGHAGEVWFGAEVMETVTAWTVNLCVSLNRGYNRDRFDAGNVKISEANLGESIQDLTSWSVLDIGTGNGLYLHALAKQGFVDLTGTDYSEAAVELARNLAARDTSANISFLVDDILESKLQRQYKLVNDKGTLDAVGLHPDGAIKRIMYWRSVSKLVAHRGLLVITSCNSTKDELIEEMNNFQQNLLFNGHNSENSDSVEQGVSSNSVEPLFQYIDHVRTYPTFTFGGIEGTRVATVAFLRC
eukprot:TRINITY_DN19617_c0_g1_i1.p1 TRINITY_DN19617_c0_g1~~TRINITY_DN19617_c0_g1_i1.p1  ORF type:complete len:354 (+),score=68.49 TRINITY_DN19617_c0_g1_i1:135-1196(+)